MARKAFLIHHDFREQVEDLSNEQLGELFRAILNYEIDNKLPLFTDKELKIAFKFIKINLDSTNQKYEEICEKRKRAGAIGGKQRVANQANASKDKQRVANQANTNTNTNTNTSTNNDNKKEKVKEKGEASSHPPIEKKRQKEQYIELVQASSLSTQVQEQILEWLEYKKWKYAEVGIKSLVTTVAKNVEKYGENAVCAVIVESMGNMWQGICWDKRGRKEQRQENKEEAEYIEDGEYLIFKKTGARIHKETYAGWSRKDN